jgi:hypothetical protein
MIDESLIGKEKTPEERQASLPEVLRNRSDEQQAEDAANQLEWGKKVASPFVQGSPAEVAHARAVRLEADWRNSIASIKLALSAEMPVAGSMRSLELRAAHANAASQLAEALAAQGKFQEAASWEFTNPVLRDEYLTLHDAIWRPDAERCGDLCARAFALDKTRLTQEDVVREVFSPKHNAVVAVVRCNMCGELNARPLGDQDRGIIERRAARQKALALTKGMDPARASETLQMAGLDPEKLFA